MCLVFIISEINFQVYGSRVSRTSSSCEPLEFVEIYYRVGDNNFQLIAFVKKVVTFYISNISFKHSSDIDKMYANINYTDTTELN